MPLSPAAPREALHTRSITCEGHRRADGLWDIEGHLVDTKTYSFLNRWRGSIESGVPVHEMWLRLTLDDNLVVRAVEAVTDHGPFEVCPAITPNFQRLVGLTIGPGWTKAVRTRLGGVEGCTHLVELLGPLATTAYQTIFPWRERQESQRASRGRPGHLGTCHALATDGPVVKEVWPQFYTGD